MSCSVREYEAHKLLLFNRTSKNMDALEKVPEDKLQPGDILLFPMDSKPSGSSGILKHAVVYCGDEEVIHFQSESSTSCSSLAGNNGQNAACRVVAGPG
ncbi:hypothetical protein llap_14961 [Limosa lapponica baueri]|uniref:NlpC/P60 domain-containing protein n=1 Tax=Limosa lapponica baueri TaxID=1758121 RepID=A0A2I0TLQ5_LIMLA|nr:hypothetical protein llap_14961 [Limosa lapponica baueri]